MKTIILASNNPVKINATLRGFQKMFPGLQFEIHTVDVPSGVDRQPVSSDETLRGATMRAYLAKERIPDAHYWVGIEGGVEEDSGGMAAFAWIVILSKDVEGHSQTGKFYLPPPVVNLIQQGEELGQADDIVFGRSNSKLEDGAIGLLTENVIDRTRLYEHAVILALVPIKNKNLYKKTDSD